MKARLQFLLCPGSIARLKNLNKLSTLFTCPTSSYRTGMAQNEKNCIVIGVGGVTNGGKTTLCKELKERLSADIFHMDDYFWPADSPNHVRLPRFNGHANWDTVEAVDFKAMYNDVTKWIDKHSSIGGRKVAQNVNVPVLVVEGILVLNHKPLFDLYSKKYFLTLTMDECVERRKLRVYEPPDPDGYFEEIVWPMYLKSKAEIENELSIHFVSGTLDPNKLLDAVMSDIKSLMQ